MSDNAVSTDMECNCFSRVKSNENVNHIFPG